MLDTPNLSGSYSGFGSAFNGSLLPNLNSSNLALSDSVLGLTDPLQQGSRLSSSSSLSTLSTGTFTVGTTGQVSIDYLFDGGAYEGEMAIFSLTGMDIQSAPDSFAREAAQRAISNSVLGHIVVSDQTEGARFSGSLPHEGGFNSGPYLGTKTFSMRPGEQFGIMLVPNGTIEDVLGDQSLCVDRLPLFSIPSLNTGGANQFAQVVNTVVNGNSFTFEDLLLSGESDRDYNDLVFQVRGATGKATSLDEVIDQFRDWRKSDLGQALIAYTTPYITPGSPDIGETVPAEVLATLKNVALKSANGNTSAISTALTYKMQPDVEQWLNESRQDLAAIKREGGQILIDTQKGLISIGSQISNWLNYVETGLELNESSANNWLTLTWNGINNAATETNSWLSYARDEFNSAIEQNNNALKATHDRFSELGVDANAWSQYQTLETDAINTFNQIRNRYYDLESSAVNAFNSVWNQFSAIETDAVENLSRVWSQYDVLAQDAASITSAAQSQYAGLQNSWNDWVGDTEAEMALLTKIIAPENPWYIDSPNPTLPKTGLPLIGLIDTGFKANDPDIDYSRISLGKDWVSGDDNPLLQPNEGDEHGTRILKVIAATRDNGIGTDGLNDQSPIWLGRAIGSNDWAQSLIEFVDTAKASNRLNAIANLSFDLTQTNADGSITTRYELTSLERAALTYAQQNHVLLVVAAGNQGSSIMSALGQASQEFDNIITVGAAENWQQANYSSYGRGIDIVAQGKAETVSGTSVAAAKVAGAASLVWAVNPQLNYSQVIDVLKRTTTDLGAPNWDSKTGVGLLNIASATYLAEATNPEPYIPLGLKLLQDSFETLGVPEDDQQTLQELYYYFDLEAKLTGSDWNSTDATASERPDLFFEALIVGGIVYELLRNKSGREAVQRAEEEKRRIDQEVQQKIDLTRANVSLTEVVAQSGITKAFIEIEEAKRNGASPEQLAVLEKNLAQIKQNGEALVKQARKEYENAQQEGRQALAAAEAKLEQVKDSLQKGFSPLRQLGEKLLGTLERGTNWITELPSRIGRTAENLWDGVTSIRPWSVDWWESFGDSKTYDKFMEWMGTNLINLGELAGAGEVAETIADFVKFNTRTLTDREIRVAKSVFGNSIDYGLVQIDQGALIGPSLTGRPYVAFNTINSWGSLSDDTLIHELTHVWQYQKDGAIYIPEALGQKYDYGGVGNLGTLNLDGTITYKHSSIMDSFNREQQAQIVQDYYSLKTGQKPKYGRTTDPKNLPIYAYYVSNVSTLPVNQL